MIHSNRGGNRGKRDDFSPPVSLSYTYFVSIPYSFPLFLSFLLNFLLYRSSVIHIAIPSLIQESLEETSNRAKAEDRRQIERERKRAQEEKLRHASANHFSLSGLTQE